jgi:hypothetical protein
MTTRHLVPLAIAAALVSVGSVAWAGGAGDVRASLRERPPVASAESDRSGGARLDTLWIYDADFSTTTGDNAGWTVSDQSGTIGQTNYWHHDTIRLSEEYLGDSTWWCGTYNSCWRQPRGYANEWYQILEREMTEIAASSSPGDLVELEFDQRYAMERNYDYGYVDVSNDDGGTWSTIASYNNTGFQGAGIPHNWNHPVDGHVTHDLSTYAGETVRLRFRFESDDAYSAQDQYDNTQHSVRDGAWQLDNITINVNGSPIFADDSESGNNGWIHEDREPAGQTGVAFWRGQFGIQFVTGRPFTCQNRPVGTWMYAPVDPFTSRMVTGEDTWLMSPPIDISGAEKLVGAWDQWADCPAASNDLHDLLVASNDNRDCVTDPDGFVDEEPGAWYADPYWYNEVDDWDAFAGNDWLAIMWRAWNDEPPEAGEVHWAGLIHNRQRVGIPSGDAGTAWERDEWQSFNDWFHEDLADALLDTARVQIKDDDDVVSAYLMASNDDGATWDAYAMIREAPESNWWQAPPPVNQMSRGSEIHYYFEATDGAGNTSVYPDRAPDFYYEFSILPIEATTETPGILLVDKNGRLTPGDQREWRQYTEFYYTEPLEILGYEWEVYDVEVPSGSDLSWGPDTSGMKYYHTQVWFASDFDAYTLWARDQYNLIQWLSQGQTAERNLLLTGNDVGYEMIATGGETLGFYNTWLASEYLENAVGVVTVDSVPGLVDQAGGYDFMTEGDEECILRGACPVLMYFDVVNARSGIPGNEVVALYEKQDSEQKPAGVAYTHQTLGYQTVNLGFGPEYLSHGTTHGGAGNYTAEGHYYTGLKDRRDLMENIMDYFGLTPTGQGTGIEEASGRNVLAQARPNPFNPVTTITFSVREAGPVTISVYDVAGRLVRTLLDAELSAGHEGAISWDGTSDAGERCASGVYFYRIAAPSFTSSRKMVMLK